MNEKDLIKEIIQKHPRHYSKMIAGNADLSSWVNNNTIVITDNFAEKIYSAVYQESGICSIGKNKKFSGINTGYTFCGRAGHCECAKAKVASGVSYTKSQYTIEQKQKINEARKKTTLEKYGVCNNAQTLKAKLKHQEFYQNLPRKIKPKKLTAYQKLNNKFKGLVNVEFVTSEDNYLGVSNHVHYRFRCLTCNSEFDDYIDNGHVPNCKTCNPYNPKYTSNQETEIFNFVKTIVKDKILQSNKSLINPYELDVVIPSKKLAIEYCGLYWHSEANKLNPDYHAKKMHLCNQIGYRLITIFEDEWTQKRSIVESRLKSILGVSDKIPARKCIISSISMSDANEFLNENHIQGASVSRYAYGCFYNQQLVAVMTFGKPRYSKKHDFELIRYASIGTVVGGAGRLLSKFVKDNKPSSIISYCDLRWGNGNLYKSLGFRQEVTSGVGYYYTDFIKRYHRSKFTKRSLVAQGADPGLTEHKIMQQKRMYRIWDCGISKWVLDNKNHILE